MVSVMLPRECIFVAYQRKNPIARPAALTFMEKRGKPPDAGSEMRKVWDKCVERLYLAPSDPPYHSEWLTAWFHTRITYDDRKMSSASYRII